MAGIAVTSRRGRQPRRQLNRDRILEAAVELIERDGPDALTMRRLGRQLGVEGMAIYHHFDNRDALLRAIGDRILAPLDELEPAVDWRDACRRFAIALRDVAVRCPATFRLLGLQPFDTSFSLRPVEQLLQTLVAEGCDAALALAIYRATVSYARGYALAEASGFTVDASRPEGRRRLAALPRSAFPILAGRGEELAELDADAAYELGLNALLAGFSDPQVIGRGPAGRVRSDRGRRSPVEGLPPAT